MTMSIHIRAQILMGERPDLESRSLDEWLIENQDQLTEDQKSRGAALIEEYYAEPEASPVGPVGKLPEGFTTLTVSTETHDLIRRASHNLDESNSIQRGDGTVTFPIAHETVDAIMDAAHGGETPHQALERLMRETFNIKPN